MSSKPAPSLRTRTCPIASPRTHHAPVLKRLPRCFNFRAPWKASRGHRRVTKSFWETSCPQTISVADSEGAHPLDISHFPQLSKQIPVLDHGDSPVSRTWGFNLPSRSALHSDRSEEPACVSETYEILRHAHFGDNVSSISQVVSAVARIGSAAPYDLLSSLNSGMQVSDNGAAQIWSMARLPPVLASAGSTQPGVVLSRSLMPCLPIGRHALLVVVSWPHEQRTHES